MQDLGAVGRRRLKADMSCEGGCTPSRLAITPSLLPLRESGFSSLCAEQTWRPKRSTRGILAGEPGRPPHANGFELAMSGESGAELEATQRGAPFGAVRSRRISLPRSSCCLNSMPRSSVVPCCKPSLQTRCRKPPRPAVQAAPSPQQPGCWPLACLSSFCWLQPPAGLGAPRGRQFSK